MSTGSTHGNTANDSSWVAEAALSTNHVPVKQGTASNDVLVSTANSEVVFGFTQETQATAGDAVAVRTNGFTLATSSGGWTKGDKLTPTTAGALVTTTTAGHLVCAIAMETVSTTEKGEVMIVSPSRLYSTFA